jgi:hypothetical protein
MDPQERIALLRESVAIARELDDQPIQELPCRNLRPKLRRYGRVDSGWMREKAAFWSSVPWVSRP